MIRRETARRAIRVLDDAADWLVEDGDLSAEQCAFGRAIACARVTLRRSTDAERHVIFLREVYDDAVALLGTITASEHQVAAQFDNDLIKSMDNSHDRRSQLVRLVLRLSTVMLTIVREVVAARDGAQAGAA